MTSSIREFVRRETKEHIDFENFNELFYILYNLIQIDIDLENVEGISEQLIPSLEKLAAQNYCRDDEISAGGKLINCLEPFAKKCLYIISPQKYKDLEKEKKKNKYVNGKPYIALARYLQELGTPSTAPREERNDRTQIMFDARELRNETIHDQYSWSNEKCFHIIGLVLSAYLLIIEKNKEELYVALQGKKVLHRYSELDLSKFGKMTVLTVRNMLDAGVKYNTGKIKHIKQYRDGELLSTAKLDEEGRFIKREGQYKGGRKITETHYDKMPDGTIKEYDSVVYEDVDVKDQFKSNEYYLLSYNESGQNHYMECHYLRDGGEDSLESTIEVEGTSDGGIRIITTRCKERYKAWYEKEDNNNYSSKMVREYNSRGQVLRTYRVEGNKSRDWDRYIYEDGVLVRKETPGRKAYVEVLHIQNEDIYREVDEEGVSGQVIEKRVFEDDRIIKIIKSSRNEDGTKSELVIEYEYY